jgi:hypothetical protein
MRTNYIAVAAYDGMHLIYDALRMTNGVVDGLGQEKRKKVAPRTIRINWPDSNDSHNDGLWNVVAVSTKKLRFCHPSPD